MALQYLRLNEGAPFPVLDGFSPYKAVVVIEAKLAPEWQAQACRWLADSGCRYMMAWGTGCEALHDAVDQANLERLGFAENRDEAFVIPDADFIMTTWHENEPLPEVFWFAKTTANHPHLVLENVLLLHIGPVDRRSEFEALYQEW